MIVPSGKFKTIVLACTTASFLLGCVNNLTPIPTNILSTVTFPTTAVPATSTPSPVPTMTLTTTPTPKPLPQSMEIISPDSADRIRELARFGKGHFLNTGVGFAVSSDGLLFAVPSTIGVYVYDFKSMQEKHFLGTESPVYTVEFSADGEFIAAGLFNGTISLWQLDNVELHRTLEGHTDWIGDLSFSPDGSILASSANQTDTTIRIWRVSDGSLLRKMNYGGETIKNSLAVKFSPDGTILATGSDNKVLLWRVSDWKLLSTTTRNHLDLVHELKFSPDSSRLYSKSWVGPVFTWDVQNGSLISDKESKEVFDSRFESRLPPDTCGDAFGGRKLFLSSDAQYVAIGSNNEILIKRVLDWSTLFSVNVEQTGQGLPYDQPVAFSTSGLLVVNTIASNYGGYELSLYQVSDGMFINKFMEPSTRHALFSPDGKVLALVTNWISLRSVSDGSELVKINQYATSIDFSSDGKFLAATGPTDGGELAIWNVADGTLLNTLQYRRASYSWTESETVAFSPDGSLLAWTLSNQVPGIYRTADLSLLFNLPKQKTGITYSVFSPDGKLMLTGAKDGQINIWNATNGKLLNTLAAHTSDILGLQFLQEGHLLASTSDDCTVRFWGIP